MPVFALFFPVPVAVAATALVHGANNLFKVALFARLASWPVVLRFGVPAVACAFDGAALLAVVSDLEPIARYAIGPREAEVTPVKLLVAVLMIGFAIFELLPRFRHLELDRRYRPAGGVLSGFFGGLSGHQGALRSAFLDKSGLSPEAFVETNAVIGFVVEVARLAVYGVGWALVAVAVGTGFLGVLAGARWLKKKPIRSIQALTGALLVGIGLALGAGVI